MGLIKKAVAIAGVKAVGEALENAEKNRKETPFKLSSKAKREAFKEFCLKAGNEFPEILTTEISGPVVTITYKPNGAILKKHASIDFNDHGTLTGKYWVTECNDSHSYANGIVKEFAKSVQKKIADEQISQANRKCEKDSFSLICPFCGYKGLSDKATTCSICGAKF